MSTIHSESPHISSDSPPSVNPLPPFLRYLPEYCILQCLACQRCYVNKNYRRHLTRIYHLSELAHKAVFKQIEQQDFVVQETEVPLLRFGFNLISGLSLLNRFVCSSVSYNFLIYSQEIFSRHYSKEHKKRFEEIIDKLYRVVLQTFFAKLPHYFRVANLIPPSINSTFTTINISNARHDLNQRYQLSLKNTFLGNCIYKA